MCDCNQCTAAKEFLARKYDGVEVERTYSRLQLQAMILDDMGISPDEVETFKMQEVQGGRFVVTVIKTKHSGPEQGA